MPVPLRLTWRTVRVAGFVLALLASSSPVVAQQPPPAPPEGPPVTTAVKGARRVDLVAAISLARTHHPLLRAAQLKTVAARARRNQAAAAYWPQVFGWVEYLRASEAGSPTVILTVPGQPRVGGSTPAGVSNTDSFNNYLVAVTAQQLLYDFGRTGGAVAAQEAMTKLAVLEEDLVALNVAAQVARAYYAVLAGRESVRVSNEAVVRTRRILEFAQAGQRSGLRPPGEVARAEADLANADLSVIRAQAELDIARNQLSNSVGVADLQLEPTATEPKPMGAPAINDAVGKALASRPELRALQAQSEVLTAQRRAAPAGHFPIFSATGGLNGRGQFGVQAGDTVNVFNWNVGLVAQVPIFQGFYVREREGEIVAEQRSLEYRVADLNLTVALEVRQALLALLAADKAQGAAQKGVDSASLALKIAESRYRTGLGTILEVTDAQATLVNAEAAAVRARYEAHTAQVALLRAQGEAYDAAQRGP
jgi:outer membrane protein